MTHSIRTKAAILARHRPLLFRVVRSNDQLLVADPCFVADSFWSKLKGLIGKQSMEPGSGLFIDSCNSIHTFFMQMPIDVVYLERLTGSNQLRVARIRRNMKPWRADLPVFQASAVLELPAGSSMPLNPGDILCLNSL